MIKLPQPVTNLKKKYTPQITDQEIEQNHKIFNERAALFKDKGLDFAKSRKFIIEKTRPLEGPILELGCGKGHTTLALAQAGYKFVSIDNDEQAIKIAALNLAYEKLLPSVEFYVMDAGALDFADSSFQNVIIVNFFHHIDKADKVLSEVNRVLSPGGRLVIADFNKRGMEIIGSIHKQEGNAHEDFGISKKYIDAYLFGLGYEIKSYDGRCHWIIISKKK